MKKFVPILLVLLLSAGCGAVKEWFDGFGTSSGRGRPSQPGVSQARQQLTDAQAAFDKKLQSAQGKDLAQVRKDWGGLEPGVSRDELTVYRWSQTARITTPKGEVSPVSSGGGTATASCLAMFIVDANGTVVDSASEGQCFDYRKMPAWQPRITESTDGRTGPIF